MPHILLAEDTEQMRFVISRTLTQQGYRVTECSTGRDLLDAMAPLLLDSQPLDIDLVITDIRMPGLTGLEVLEGIVTLPGFPPFILITAYGAPETHARARQLGAVASFDKPLDLEKLCACVGRQLRPEAGSSQHTMTQDDTES